MSTRFFHPFPRMPQELQDMVWKLAIENFPPRVIRAHIRNDIVLNTYVLVEAGSLIPPTLQVCSSSRDLALKRYSVVPSKLLLNPGHNTLNGAQYYINFSVDTIYISHRTLYAPVAATYHAALKEIAWYGKNIHKEPYLAIKHVAFRGSTAINSLFTRGPDNTGTAEFYHICMQNKTIQSISIVVDNTLFDFRTQRPEAHKYTLEDIPWTISQRRGDFSTRNRDNIRDTIQDFRTSPVVLATAGVSQGWSDFMALCQAPLYRATYGFTWQLPDIRVKMIRKTRR